MQLIAGTHSQPSDKMGGHLPHILNLFQGLKIKVAVMGTDFYRASAY